MTDSAGRSRGGGRVPAEFIEGLLSRVDIVGVVGQSVGLEKRGTNYFGLCPFHGEKTASFTVEPEKQFYHCFGCGVHGNAITFLMEHRGLGFMEALRELAADVGLTVPDTPEPGGARSTVRRQPQGTAGKPSAKQARQPSGKPAGEEGAEPADDTWHDAGAWPPDGPPHPKAHSYRGRPVASWAYTDAAGGVLGWVHRFVTSSGGKEILPCVWSKHPTKGMQWRWRHFDAPRPLFALHEIARDATRPVLVVEGEKCVEAAQPLLPDWAVTTWPGGCKADGKADWSCLAGRRVVLWPDCDAKIDKRTGELLPEHKQPGVAADERIAAALAQLGSDVSIVCIPAPGDRADGWDVADLIAECSVTAADPAAAVRAWLDPARLRAPASSAPAEPTAPTSAPTDEPPPNPSGAAPAKPDRSRKAIARDAVEAALDADGVDPQWRKALVWGRDGLERHTANIVEILRNDARWQGVVAFDEFAHAVIKRREPPYFRGRLGEWSGEDDSRTSIWLAQQYGLIVSSKQVVEAVETVARERSFHPIVAYLRGLAWDGTRRAENWLTEFAGVPDSPYTRAVATYFLRGMVRRVMEPGCKFDYCLVVEGAEGLRKSTLAATLGGAWGSDTPLDLANNREAALALHGNWVLEFSEMESVTRVEAHAQKSFLSRTFDQYRPFWASRNVKVPRQCVFVGTTNETEYIKEGQGARRFWPVTVTAAIDIDGLRRAMPQLLAEAMADVDAGERTWPTEEEQRELFRPEQMKRVQQESLIDALHDWVLDPGMDEIASRSVHGGAFSLADAAFRCLKVSYAQLTRDLQSRVGKALAALGCERLEKRNGMTRYWYKPPPKKAATFSSAREPAQHPREEKDDLPI